MAKRNIVVQTNNKEIYEKLRSLLFVPEVLIDNSQIEPFRLNRIINNINKRNKDGEVLQKEVIDKYTLIRKTGPVDFSIYFKWLIFTQIFLAKMVFLWAKTNIYINEIQIYMYITYNGG